MNHLKMLGNYITIKTFGINEGNFGTTVVISFDENLSFGLKDMLFHYEVLL